MQATCRPCDPGAEWTRAAELEMAELVVRSWLLLLHSRWESCPVPYLRMPAGRDRRGGQFLLSHSQWNRVTVWVL